MLIIDNLMLQKRLSTKPYLLGYSTRILIQIE